MNWTVFDERGGLWVHPNAYRATDPFNYSTLWAAQKARRQILEATAPRLSDSVRIEEGYPTAELFTCLDDFVSAAVALENAWTDFERDHGGRCHALTQCYPEGLPSFDEFVGQLIRWRHANNRSRE